MTSLLNLQTVIDDNSVRCRFPARTTWLAQQLSKPEWKDFSNCDRLNVWANFSELESVSLIMISGYFGNPASTFGHSLMRINNGGQRDSALLDLGINFGARVPPQEPTLRYIIRGLAGGYQAGFSDRTFFEHDQTYSRVEFRDRWEYTLALTADEAHFLTMHIWELAARQFTYYFLEQNCSYRLAELLELVFDRELLSGVTTWYAPVSLFHDLRDAEATLGRPLFTDVTYVPSVEQVLRYRLAGLTVSEQESLFAIADPTLEWTVVVDQLNDHNSTKTRQLMYAAALDYFNYVLAGSEEDEHHEIRTRRQQVLQARLGLPVTSNAQPTPPPPRRPPSSRTGPSAIEAGLGHTENSDNYLALGIAAFRHRSIGDNSLQGSSLVVADVGFGIAEQEGVFLNYLDIVRAQKRNAPYFRLPNESKASWSVAAGVERRSGICLDCLESYASGWYGRAFRAGRSVTISAGLAGRLSSKGQAVEIGPTASLQWRPTPHFASAWSATVDHAPANGRTDMRFTWQARWSLMDRWELNLRAFERDGYNTTVTLTYRH
ncbi:MAG: DUF4105 domain-containing protein [Pseudomonadota bacterium]